MKIVVCYDTGGDYECGSYHHSLCFEYESPEAFLVDFETAVKEKIERLQRWNEREKKWQDEKPAPYLSGRGKNRELLKQKHAEWLNQRPSITDDFERSDFNFCGYEFSIHDFTYGGNYANLDLPNVYSLEEWHDECMKQGGEL
jgi:hypothetical protein